MADIARLTEVIEPEAKALGFELVRVKMTSSEAGDGDRALQVMAEDPATGQLIIDQCAALSRRISDRLDALEADGEVIVEGAYHLEVSSPGIDRPLTRPNDFSDWSGHEAKISMDKAWDKQRNYKGELKGLEDGMAVIEDAKAGEVRLPLSKIHAAKLVLTDALIAATQPLDTSGAEDIVEDTTTDEEKADD
ncbi:ribosome maturation protein RimP [Qipengyuania atrilutea]|uniref:Ribosome maturation factor RimP n=1 Tax=Qipengyuania atrilutea TaxID=2744473 RepID=A0A850GVE1_9SPHN|nr:ribosome maturation protein RimP [Actirhodobacter atriluteus]NVD43451.1 ribosome maturation protein RimP [Actirhodobacter atriluteus]